MQVDYYDKYYEPFNEAIKEADYFGEKIKRFVLNEKELIDYWLYVNPGKKKITVKYGNQYFSDPIEQSLASEVQRGNIKLDYIGIPVVYKGA